MSDTQWPRYIVFLQERADTPHQYVGSVHAPDAELALLNARDVFVRRPACVSLWVVSAKAVLSRTAQELAYDGLPAGGEEFQAESCCVFYKLADKGTFTFDSETTAGSPAEALRQAAAKNPAAKAIWVVPAWAVYRTTGEDVPPMFGTAQDKTAFRDQAEFRITTTMQQIKRAADDEA